MFLRTLIFILFFTSPVFAVDLPYFYGTKIIRIYHTLQHDKLVMDCAFEWQEVIGIQFVQTNNLEDADIVIKSGNLNSYGNYRKIKNKAYITISNDAIINKQYLDDVLLHEIGHALGLSHSNSPNDIMYFRVVNTKLSANDKQRMRILYLIRQEF